MSSLPSSPASLAVAIHPSSTPQPTGHARTEKASDRLWREGFEQEGGGMGDVAGAQGDDGVAGVDGEGEGGDGGLDRGGVGDGAGVDALDGGSEGGGVDAGDGLLAG